jgi:hypothetical protein
VTRREAAAQGVSACIIVQQIPTDFNAAPMYSLEHLQAFGQLCCGSNKSVAVWRSTLLSLKRLLGNRPIVDVKKTGIVFLGLEQHPQHSTSSQNMIIIACCSEPSSTCCCSSLEKSRH